MSKAPSISSLRESLRLSEGDGNALRAQLRELQGRLDEALTKLGAAGQVRRELETERDAARAKVDELKRLLHAAEIEAARLGGVVARMREEEASAALPVVETTQKTVSRQIGTDAGLYSANLGSVDYSGGYRERNGKHWTGL